MFTTRLHYKTLIEGQLWQLEAPLRYAWTEQDYERFYLRDRAVIIPAGYVTDFYSIPAWAQGCFPKDTDPVQPAILHDYLYTYYHMRLRRVQADMLFLHAMREMDVPRFKRNMFYAAVRLGGKYTWHGRVQRRREYLQSLGIKCHANGQPA